MRDRDTIYKGFDYILSFDPARKKFFLGDRTISSNIRDIEYNEKDGLLIIYRFDAPKEDEKVICIPVSSINVMSACGTDAGVPAERVNEAIAATNECIDGLRKVLEQTNNNTRDIASMKRRLDNDI